MAENTYNKIFNKVGLTLSLVSLGTSLLHFIVPSSTLVLRIALYQTFFLVEVFNSALGKTGQKLLPSILQITSRLFVVWHVCVGRSQSRVFGIMATSWYLADSVRFSYYLCKDSPLLKNLRYNLFILLYPLGVLCELYLIKLRCQKTSFPSTDLYTVAILLYTPGFPFLYYHMWLQRKRALYSAGQAQSTRKTKVGKVKQGKAKVSKESKIR